MKMVYYFIYHIFFLKFNLLVLFQYYIVCHFMYQVKSTENIILYRTIENEHWTLNTLLLNQTITKCNNSQRVLCIFMS